MGILGKRTVIPAAVLVLGSLGVAVGLSVAPTAGGSHHAGDEGAVAANDMGAVADASPAAGAGALGRGEPSARPPGPAMTTPTAGTAGPDASTLAAVADYVSPDGSYVRIGSVEISATPALGRTHAAL